MKSLYILFIYIFKGLLFLGTVLFSQNALGQDRLPKVVKPEKRISFVPFPFIAANPTAGFLFGFTPALNFYTADPATTSMSTAIGVALISTNRQVYTSIRSNAFLKEDRWSIFLDTRYNIDNLPTYVLGSNMDSPIQEQLFFNAFRFYGTALKKYADTRFFYGLGYLYDAAFNIENEEQPQPSVHQEYQNLLNLSHEAYRQSGISFNAMWDSRDNVANPYTGSFSLISWRTFPQLLGSTTNSGQLWLEHRNYFTLSSNRPRHLLGLWSFAWLTTGGEVPYLFLPGLGFDMFNRSGRPFTFGRFRGENLVYGELEWRFPLLARKDWLGGVVFLNTTTASNRFNNLTLFQYLQFGYGGGLRLKIIPKKRINLGFDYGWGANGARGYFINLNEVF
jgi:outer membrane protein assembly factor BamA